MHFDLERARCNALQLMSRDDAMAQMDEYREELEDYGMTPESLAAMAAQKAEGSSGGGSDDATAEFDASAPASKGATADEL